VPLDCNEASRRSLHDVVVTRDHPRVIGRGNLPEPLAEIRIDDQHHPGAGALATIQQDEYGAIDDDIWSLYHGPVLLARFDEREMKFYG